MQQTKRPPRDAIATQPIFNTATATVAGLYLASHSVSVTAIGASASTVVACWSMWLTRP